MVNVNHDINVDVTIVQVPIRRGVGANSFCRSFCLSSGHCNS